MARQGINTGSSPDAGDGDALLIGAIKINDNFNEIYTLLGDGTTLAPGIVTSIVAGTNVTVSGSTGQVTINASGSGGSSSQWVTTAAGIHTLSSVGIGTTNPTSALTVKGNTSLETLTVSGVSTFIGNASFNTATFGDSDTLDFGDSNDLRIWHDGTTNIIKNQTASSLEINLGTNSNSIFSVKNQTQTLARFYRDALVDGRVELYHNDSKKFETIGAGVTVTGTTFTNQLSVSGVSTFSSNLNATNILLSTGNSLYAYNSGGSYHQLGGVTQDLLLFKSRGVGPISDISINILNDTLNTGGGSDESVFKVYGDGGLRSYYHTISGGSAIQSERFSVTGGDSSGATPTEVVMKVGTGVTAYGSGVIYSTGDVRVGVDTSKGVILTSPNGTQYRLIVDNAGTLSTVAV